MQISPKQMSAFSQARLRSFLGERAQRPVVHAELFDLCLRGERYGLVSEQELAGYVVIAGAVEAWRSPRDPAWIARIMRDSHRVAFDRVAALYRAADHGAARA